MADIAEIKAKADRLVELTELQKKNQGGSG